ncbi:hypothetical protein OY671_012435, partial [Metschnikowia pulcherrima]
MPILDAATTGQLKAYLGNSRRPIELVASSDDSAKSAETRSLVEEIAAQSDKVTARFDGTDARKPSFAIRADEGRAEAVFAGSPMGHEFTSSISASSSLSVIGSFIAMDSQPSSYYPTGARIAYGVVGT